MENQRTESLTPEIIREVSDGLTGLILSEAGDQVFCLTVNRPEALNALDAVTLQSIEKALDWLADNRRVKVLLITGSGQKAFVAGADIAHMKRLTPLQAKDFSALGMRVFRRLETAPFPVIALVNGYALGGGCELALSCDFILAAEHARFAQPEVTLGVTPGFGGSQRLSRLVGRAMASELLFSGRMMSAEEAKCCGLVNHVYPADELFRQGMQLANRISANSATAIQLTKQALQRGQDMDLENACGFETGMFALSFAGADREKGMVAFLEGARASFD